MADAKTISECLGALEAAFGPVDEARSRLYSRRFADPKIGGVELKQAIARCIDECGRWPLVKDILDRLPERGEMLTAEVSWTKALAAAVDGPGVYDPVQGWCPTGEGLDPAILEAVGGRRGLKRLLAISEDADRLHWARRDFVESFRPSDRPALPPGSGGGLSLPPGFSEGVLRRV